MSKKGAAHFETLPNKATPTLRRGAAASRERAEIVETSASALFGDGSRLKGILSAEDVRVLKDRSSAFGRRRLRNLFDSYDEDGVYVVYKQLRRGPYM